MERKAEVQGCWEREGCAPVLGSTVCLLLSLPLALRPCRGCLPRQVRHHHFVRAYCVWVEQDKGHKPRDRLGLVALGSSSQ